MARTIKVAAAQTGPVLREDMRPGVEVACGMIEKAARQGAEIVCFSELFLTPFFPNQLRSDYEHFFLELPSPITDPLFETAHLHRDGRLRLENDVPGAGEAAGLGDGDEGTELVEIEAGGHVPDSNPNITVLDWRY